MNINTDLFFQIYNLSQKNPILDSLMVFGADYLIFIVYFLILIWAIFGKSKDRKAFILSMLGLGIAFIISQIIRIFIHEDRPFVTLQIIPLIPTKPWLTVLSFSLGGVSPLAFPSLHTVIISTITFSYIYFKSILSPFLIFSLIWITFARIFVGVHYPLDILGGILVGFLSIFIVLQLKKLLHI